MYLRGVSNPSTFVPDEYEAQTLEAIQELRRLLPVFHTKRDAETYRACFVEIMLPLYYRMARGVDRQASSKQCLTIDAADPALTFFATIYTVFKNIDVASLDESIRDKFQSGGEAIVLLRDLRRVYAKAHHTVCGKSPHSEYYKDCRMALGLDK